MTDAELICALRHEAAHALLNTSLAPKDLLAQAANAIARLTADGPIVQRGTAGDGTPWMGTMREAWNDALLDAGRWHFLAPRLLAADFDWQDSGKCVLAFEWPKNVGVGGSAEQNVDAAIAATQTTSPLGAHRDE